MAAPNITATTRRAYEVVEIAGAIHLHLWSRIGGTFSMGEYPDADSAERAGKDYVANGWMPERLTDVIRLGPGRVAA